MTTLVGHLFRLNSKDDAVGTVSWDKPWIGPRLNGLRQEHPPGRSMVFWLVVSTLEMYESVGSIIASRVKVENKDRTHPVLSQHSEGSCGVVFENFEVPPPDTRPSRRLELQKLL